MSDVGVTFFNATLVPTGLMLIMFSMGLTLRLRDFALVVQNFRLVSAGLGTHLFLLPLLGLGIGALFRLPPELAFGLFLVSICPAGTTSNALTFVAGGNVALAVILTALTSLVTVFTIPLLLSWAIPWFLSDVAHVQPVLSISATVLQLLRITAGPIVAGMILRSLAPDVASKMAIWLRPTSFVILIAVIGVSVLVSMEMVLQRLVAATPAIWTLNVAAMGLGVGIGRLLGVSSRDAMTLGIETGVQNVSLALFLTLTVLHSLPLAVTQNIYGVIMLLNASILIGWWRRRMATEARREI